MGGNCDDDDNIGDEQDKDTDDDYDDLVIYCISLPLIEQTVSVKLAEISVSLQNIWQRIRKAQPYSAGTAFRAM